MNVFREKIKTLFKTKIGDVCGFFFKGHIVLIGVFACVHVCKHAMS